ncbi:MAG TPA: hypothetical protein VK335_25245 [Bryobacteraceae bacterium]|nr:hypothetical protein [Bryobacteraceae bacterium]
MKALLRIFSYLFGAALALFALAISALSLRSGGELNLGFLPWTGKSLSYWLLGLALAGLITLLLAMSGTMRVLFFLWSLGIFILVFKGMFLSLYRFTGGAVSFKAGVELSLGMLLGAIGSFPWPRKPEPVRRPQRW